eukprot:3653649-Rhodomonas_salina.1
MRVPQIRSGLNAVFFRNVWYRHTLVSVPHVASTIRCGRTRTSRVPQTRAVPHIASAVRYDSTAHRVAPYSTRHNIVRSATSVGGSRSWAGEIKRKTPQSPD